MINSNKLLLLLFLFSITILGTSCYSFKGISIDPNTKTFFVANFENSSTNVVPTLATTYQNLLDQKIRNESSLKQSELDPDIEFKGTITSYRVTSEAPTSDNEIAFNRLTIQVLVEYTNNKDEEKNWSTRFSHFNDFANDVNLIEVQDELINNIGDQLVEDIFNKAFTDW